MADKDLHSTGRGGAGNIGHGEGEYTDPAAFDGKPGKATIDHPSTLGQKGGIIHDSRTGAAVGAGAVPAPVGEYVSKPAGAAAQAAYPEYHTGRGGEGNRHKEHTLGDKPAEGEGQAAYADYHTGRGGEGNVHKDKYEGHSKPVHKEHHGGGGGEGLVEKVKHAVGLEKK